MERQARRARGWLLAGTLAGALTLGGCEQPSQNRYAADEVGHSTVVKFGTVVAARSIDITGKNTGAGALVGGAGGGIAGSTLGHGGGNAAAILGGVVVGAVAGAVAEQALADRTGLEYTIVLENGKTITIAQEQNKTDRVFAAGDRVMVQASGSYQRVLPTDNLPAEVSRPQGIKIKD
jgi:outer membrane lipoprotein SlyB